MRQEQIDLKIYPIPVLRDNIIWVWVSGNQAVVVDPAVPEPVETFLKQKDLNLNSILQTHHHDDHIGGTRTLLKKWPKALVFASEKDKHRIPFQTNSVRDEECFKLLGCLVRVLAVPGHTKTHICFFVNAQKGISPILFSGDTLFSGGCGKLFEGSFSEMFKSLRKINSLPSKTKVYCAHEYTEANLKWASSILPDDKQISNRLIAVSKKRANGELSLPSNLEEERRSNLFIKARNVNEFTFLRIHKDNWQG